MARDFAGGTDAIACGSDASIDGFVSYTIAVWVRADAASAQSDPIAMKRSADTNGWDLGWQAFLSPPEFELQVGFSTTNGIWRGGAQTAGQLYHLVVVYDNSSTANNPTIFVDGTSVTVTQSQAPAGTAGSDAAGTLQLGTEFTATRFFDGVVGFFAYHNGFYDSAMVNRHRWWGCAPGGPSTVKVWHPLWTTDLNNKGTATANGTATGTTVDNASVPKVERMWGSLMGCGR